MEKERLNKLIERYLDDAEAEFDQILEDCDRKRRRRTVLWSAVLCPAFAAVIALVLWLGPLHPSHSIQPTPIQIAEGIQQMMLLDIGEIESIVATPGDSYAILTAHLKDGKTCSYILRCNDENGTTTLIAYNDKH